jgi:hypothetical protein
MRDMTNSTLEVLLGAFLLLMPLSAVQAGSPFQLGKSQNISCSRSFARGGLKTMTCTSYVYVFNTRTSDYFRCEDSLVVTRDRRKVRKVKSDGGCIKKPRVFEVDSSYDFDSAETEPASPNSIFGKGGYAVWAADTTRPRVRGCLIISTGLGSEVSRCVETKLD